MEYLSAAVPLLERVWRILALATSADNESLGSRGLRAFLTAFSHAFVYTKAAGSMLNAMVYLVDYHWYVLSISCAVVVLAMSAAVLTWYEWMWRWQAWIRISSSSSSIRAASSASSSQHHRVVTVEDEDDDDEDGDDDDDDDSWQAWAKKLGRILVILLGWSLFCYVNVRLDYWVFWSQYSVAHPKFNLELIFVNCLQATPILVGSAYTLYHLVPTFYTWHHHPSLAMGGGLPTSSGDETTVSMQSLLS
jgi:hypothetical protein